LEISLFIFQGRNPCVDVHSRTGVNPGSKEAICSVTTSPSLMPPTEGNVSPPNRTNRLNHADPYVVVSYVIILCTTMVTARTDEQGSRPTITSGIISTGSMASRVSVYGLASITIRISLTRPSWFGSQGANDPLA